MQAKFKIDLPIPEVSEVKTYGAEAKAFEPSEHYVRHIPGSQHQARAGAEYDMDHDDDEFLRKHPRYGENGDPSTRLQPSLFEKAITVLEEEQSNIDAGAAGRDHPATSLATGLMN